MAINLKSTATIASSGVKVLVYGQAGSGKTTLIRELLHKYGASKLSAVDPKDYEALLFDVEGLNEF